MTGDVGRPCTAASGTPRLAAPRPYAISDSLFVAHRSMADFGTLHGIPQALLVFSNISSMVGLQGTSCHAVTAASTKQWSLLASTTAFCGLHHGLPTARGHWTSTTVVDRVHFWNNWNNVYIFAWLQAMQHAGCMSASCQWQHDAAGPLLWTSYQAHMRSGWHLRRCCDSIVAKHYQSGA